ncbi:hypothetical protein [Micromonospora sp. CPCC 205561]|uniref:hypothetical protein n=1 Tax=Micromonospora sp. CPCC 205561 TaxID=3122407 RepID=UPI002FEEA36E
MRVTYDEYLEAVARTLARRHRPVWSWARWRRVPLRRGAALPRPAPRTDQPWALAGMSTLRPGDVLLIGAACSVQFGGDRALRLRLVSVDERPTYPGWAWLTGYVLNDAGLAVDKREIYVLRSGLRVLTPRPPGPAATGPAGRTAARGSPGTAAATGSPGRTAAERNSLTSITKEY